MSGSVDAEGVLEDQVHGPRSAEEHLHRRRAHEGRHHERQHAERLDEDRAAELEAHREVGERHRDQRREPHRHDRHVEAVGEGFAHQRDFRERGEVREREAALPVGERRVDHRHHGDDEERDEEGGDRQRDRRRFPGCCASPRVTSRCWPARRPSRSWP